MIAEFYKLTCLFYMIDMHTSFQYFLCTWRSPMLTYDLVWTFRLESTTQPPKKRHSARKQSHQPSRTVPNMNATRSRHTFLRTAHESSASPTTTENTNQMKNANMNFEEVFTIQPETSTQNVSKRRHRRHHRRRYLQS